MTYSIVSSIVEPIVSGMVSSQPAAGGGGSEQLIANGDMSSTTGWNLNGWSFAGDQATSPGDNSVLWRVLERPTVNAEPLTYGLNIVSNPGGVLTIMQLFTGDPVTPDTTMNLVGSTAAGMQSGNTNATGIFDRVRIRGVITADVIVVDDASLTAP